MADRHQRFHDEDDEESKQGFGVTTVAETKQVRKEQVVGTTTVITRVEKSGGVE